MLRATKVAEEAGVPGVAIVASGFMRQAKITAKLMGMPDLAMAEYPGQIPLDSPDAFADKVWNKVLPAVVDQLSTPIHETVAGPAEPADRDIVFAGTLDQVQEHFDNREWSDGLPIVPPTRERVAEFLTWTDRDPGEVMGILAPEFREATIWSIAVNGVMAGCRPEYMPVLIAAVEAIADPDFRLVDAGATPGWEPLVVVSGEIVEALNFNTEVGSMRVGRRANSTIGRFLRLYMRNVAGFRPGSTDKGSIGLTFNVAMGENEAAIRSIGWDPLRVDLGFTRDDNVVMVQSALAVSMPVYIGGTDPQFMAGPLVRYMEGTTGPWSVTGLMFSRWHPLIQMCPAIAEGFAKGGWGKNRIQQYLYEQCKTSARWMELCQLHATGQDLTLKGLVERGSAPPVYAASDDPERLVPLLLRPEWTRIVVGGDPEKNQCRIYINNHEQGAPTARRIRLPADWRQRLKRADHGA